MVAIKYDGSDLNKIRASRKPLLLPLAELLTKLDPELAKLVKISIKDTARNRETAFWNDSLSQTLCEVTAAEIIGDGLKIRCDDKKAKDIILDFNMSINVKRATIEDYIKESWFDSIIHANSYWRVLLDKDYEFGVDIQRLDPKTIVVDNDPNYGWRVFLQRVGKYKSHRSKYAFYREKKKQFDFQEYRRNEYGQVIPVDYSQRNNVVFIPDEPHVILFTDFFKKPPIGSALHYIVYKKYIAIFMKKYSQKHWAPYILAFIGDPKSNYYPQTPEEMQESIDLVTKQIPKITSWGGAAFPGDTRIETLQSATRASSEIYVSYMQHMNKEIMWSLYGSMGLIDPKGEELATGRILEHGRFRFLKGIRRRYELKLINFYAYCLLPANGIKIKPRKIDIEFSTLRSDEPGALMNAVFQGRQAGVFKDKNELRKACQPVWDWLEELSAGENKKLEEMLPGSAGQQSQSAAERLKKLKQSTSK